MFYIMGIVLGIALTIAGIYYLNREKGDRESVKIYKVVILVGIILAIVSGVIMQL